MLWSPDFMASFVKEHLGPVLAAEHPDVSIIGFDHNKDHVVEWATGLYKVTPPPPAPARPSLSYLTRPARKPLLTAGLRGPAANPHMLQDPEAAKYFSGLGVHWYGGLNTDKLEATHALAPSKYILATEACNCVGNVIFSAPNVAAWWTRAEKLALDILEDLRFWAVGWIDWNLVIASPSARAHPPLRCPTSPACSTARPPRARAFAHAHRARLPLSARRAHALSLRAPAA